ELRLKHRDEIEPLIEEALSEVSVEEAEQRLDAAGIAYARLNEAIAIHDHPQMTARDRLRTVDSEGGPVTMLKPPFNVDGWPAGDAPTSAPALGAHTDAVLTELGYDAQQV